MPLAVYYFFIDFVEIFIDFAEIQYKPLPKLLMDNQHPNAEERLTWYAVLPSFHQTDSRLRAQTTTTWCWCCLVVKILYIKYIEQRKYRRAEIDSIITQHNTSSVNWLHNYLHVLNRASQNQISDLGQNDHKPRKPQTQTAP